MMTRQRRTFLHREDDQAISIGAARRKSPQTTREQRAHVGGSLTARGRALQRTISPPARQHDPRRDGHAFFVRPLAEHEVERGDAVSGHRHLQPEFRAAQRPQRELGVIGIVVDQHDVDRVLPSQQGSPRMDPHAEPAAFARRRA